MNSGALILALLLSILASAGESIQGRVVAVHDGDTITVLVGRQQVKVRLDGVDAPELKQDFGSRAKQFASGLVFDKTVTLQVKGKDRYGRTLGDVLLPDGRNLNQELLRAGFAWWFKRYAPKRDDLERLEAEARRAKRGLWAGKPVPPWEFRKGPDLRK